MYLPREGHHRRVARTILNKKRRGPGRGGLQGARPRTWQLGGPASRGLSNTNITREARDVRVSVTLQHDLRRVLRVAGLWGVKVHPAVIGTGVPDPGGVPCMQAQLVAAASDGCEMDVDRSRPLIVTGQQLGRRSNGGLERGEH
eukprot:1195855-Prorocentrum_minimum.AAC.7